MLSTKLSTTGPHDCPQWLLIGQYGPIRSRCFGHSKNIPTLATTKKSRDADHHEHKFVAKFGKRNTNESKGEGVKKRRRKRQ